MPGATTLRHTDKVACKAFVHRLSLRLLSMWEWLGPGGLPGLQNLWRVALRAAVGSTPIHSRLLIMPVRATLPGYLFFLLDCVFLHFAFLGCAGRVAPTQITTGVS